MPERERERERVNKERNSRIIIQRLIEKYRWYHTHTPNMNIIIFNIAKILLKRAIYIYIERERETEIERERDIYINI